MPQNMKNYDFLGFHQTKAAPACCAIYLFQFFCFRGAQDCCRVWVVVCEL